MSNGPENVKKNNMNPLENIFSMAHKKSTDNFSVGIKEMFSLRVPQRSCFQNFKHYSKHNLRKVKHNLTILQDL